uniref:Uncharacterized protein n=1 Tax=Chlamydomonas leiostraca TaxID=1034604 RepID=A0A7S0R2D4_9CHLO|mmetsp:Transcript_12220/g.29782  ORF Transcript_12220/g.29782 Transcript_12220/m.29782 type:complete len:310 (+) Transcript_12220:60-989(+)
MFQKTYPGVANPSNLSYRERLSLEEENTAEYNRLWKKAYRQTVWERLLEDASTRQERTRTSKPYQEGAHVGHLGTLSGFSTNSEKPVYTLTSFKSGHNTELAPAPSVMDHPQLVRKFMQKQKLEYYQAIRPDCETTNQTLRMLSTYETDIVHAARGHVHIPPCSPAMEGNYFHPDVRLTDVSYATARRAADAGHRVTLRTRPMSAHPTVGRFSSVPPSPAKSHAAAAAAAVSAASQGPASPSVLPPAAAKPPSPRPASAHPGSLSSPKAPAPAAASPHSSLKRQAAMRPHSARSPSDTITKRVHWGGML